METAGVAENSRTAEQEQGQGQDQQRNSEIETQPSKKARLDEDNNTSLPHENRVLLNLLDFTLLDHNASDHQIDHFCNLANKSRPAAVCVFAEHVKRVKTLIDSDISVAAVAAGFPVGSSDVDEIKSSISIAVDAGADEIDCVLEPRNDVDFPGDVEMQKLQAMREASGPLVLKVILETSLLNETSIRAVSQMALQCGADFLKSSTGKRGGCTPEVASILSEEVNKHYHSTGSQKGVKLSGGIKTIRVANELLSLVIQKCPTISLSANSLGGTVANLCRRDSQRIRIGASGILEELMPSLYSNEVTNGQQQSPSPPDSERY